MDSMDNKWVRRIFGLGFITVIFLLVKLFGFFDDNDIIPIEIGVYIISILVCVLTYLVANNKK